MTPLRKQLYGTTTLTRDPISIGVAIAGYIGAGTVATAVIVGLTAVAISVATSWVINALTPQPEMPASLIGSSSSGILVNQKSPLSPHDIVYGQVRKGGTITYYETTGGSNRYLHQVIAVAGHEVEEIGDIYINDEIVTLDGSGFVTGNKWIYRVRNNEGEVTSTGPAIRIRKYTGNQTAADPDLVSESTQINSSFVGKGIAYLYVRYRFDAETFANGVPLITTVVKGAKVFDPRTGTTAYSNNAALCTRDYLTAEYGMNTGDVNETSFSVAANICDEAVPLSGGGTEPRYTMNGIVNSGTLHQDVLNRMMTCCTGTLYWGAGPWRLTVSAYTAPVKTFTLDDLRSDIQVIPRTDLRDQFNYVQGTFNDAATRWITVDYPPISSTVFEAEDGGEQTSLDLKLPMTTSSPSAQRIAKLTLFRAREQMVFTADFSVSAYDVEVGDIIALDIDRYGWVGKEFEVVGYTFGTDGEGGALRVRLSLRETSEAVYDWDAEESAIINNNTNLLSRFEVPAVGVNVSDELRIFKEKLTNVVTVVVTSGAAERISTVEVQFKPSGETQWKNVGMGELGRYEVLDIDDGLYDFRARAINTFGVRGNWTTFVAYPVDGLIAPPSDVTGFAAEVNGATISLEWDAVPDLDLSYYTIRHAVEETGATYANATTVVEKVPRPATSVTVPARSGTYLIKAIDKQGKGSENYTSVVVPAADLQSFANTLSQVEHPTFTGTKTDCSVISSALRITDPSVAPSEATYDFSAVIDTGAVRQVRSRVEAVLERIDNAAGLFDDLPGLFDDLPGLFDDFTGAVQFADVNVKAYISTTDDDPTGTPTWSAYRLFRTGDYSGRAFRFRIVLTSANDNVTPSVKELTAFVEYD